MASLLAVGQHAVKWVDHLTLSTQHEQNQNEFKPSCQSKFHAAANKIDTNYAANKHKATNQH